MVAMVWLFLAGDLSPQVSKTAQLNLTFRNAQLFLEGDARTSSLILISNGFMVSPRSSPQMCSLIVGTGGFKIFLKATKTTANTATKSTNHRRKNIATTSLQLIRRLTQSWKMTNTSVNNLLHSGTLYLHKS